MASVDQMFEGRPLGASTKAAAAAATAVGAPAVPVLDVLSGLLPEGLRRGEAVSLAGSLAGGDRSPGYLALALLAGALRAGLWCAAVGVPGLGGLALADLLGRGPERRAGLARLLVAPEPGEQWAQVTAALADGVDLLLLRPPKQVPAQLARRIDARLRQSRAGGTRHSAALLVLGAWPGARLELRTARTVWTGLSGIGPTAGTGHLTGGQATVVAAGRATGGRTRTARLWLPTATGTAEPMAETAAPSIGAAAPLTEAATPMIEAAALMTETAASLTQAAAPLTEAGSLIEVEAKGEGESPLTGTAPISVPSVTSDGVASPGRRLSIVA